MRPLEFLFQLQFNFLGFFLQGLRCFYFRPDLLLACLQSLQDGREGILFEKNKQKPEGNQGPEDQGTEYRNLSYNFV